MTDLSQATVTAKQRDWPLLLIMMGLGLAGVGTLIFVPFETILPPQIHIPRIVLLIQPAVITIACAGLGWWAAPRTGLDAPVFRAALHGQGWQSPLRRGVPAALVTAAAVALILIVYGLSTQDLTTAMPQLDVPLIARLGYGGIGEEIIARWGLLTGLMALAMRLGQSRTRAFWVANSIAALLFALGHFGVLFAMVPDPALWLMFAVVLGNFVPAVAFGWLYRQFGIESAMIAHGGAHALFCAAAASGLVNW
jgi:hypothetical protein